MHIDLLKTEKGIELFLPYLKRYTEIEIISVVGRYAYMTGTSFEMYRNMHSYCDLTWMSEYFYETPKAWAMPKGSPFRERFNKM